MIDLIITNGTIGRCPTCGGDDLFEDGRFYCFGLCHEISGSGEGEASGPEQASTAR